MFAASDAWKSDLSGVTLKKVEELEAKLEKANKERNQRQMKNETLEQALDKQKQKVSKYP